MTRAEIDPLVIGDRFPDQNGPRRVGAAHDFVGCFVIVLVQRIRGLVAFPCSAVRRTVHHVELADCMVGQVSFKITAPPQKNIPALIIGILFIQPGGVVDEIIVVVSGVQGGILPDLFQIAETPGAPGAGRRRETRMDKTATTTKSSIIVKK